MNTGLQDAYNLAWKLALVVKRQADAALLDTYEGERVPVAQRLLNTTDRAFRLVVSDSWIAGLLRTKVIARIAAFALGSERIQKFAFRTVSQTGIRYRRSAPRGGDRFPWLRLKFQADGAIEDLFQRLDDTRFNLIVAGQPAPPEGALSRGDLLRVHAIPDDPANDTELARAQISKPSFYLLRPDGHVATCGTRWDEAVVKQYVSEQVHLRT